MNTLMCSVAVLISSGGGSRRLVHAHDRHVARWNSSPAKHDHVISCRYPRPADSSSRLWLKDVFKKRWSLSSKSSNKSSIGVQSPWLWSSFEPPNTRYLVSDDDARGV